MRSRNHKSKEPSFVVSKVLSARPKHRLIRNTMVALFIVGFKSPSSKDNLSSRLSFPFWGYEFASIQFTKLHFFKDKRVFFFKAL